MIDATTHAARLLVLQALTDRFPGVFRRHHRHDEVLLLGVGGGPIGRLILTQDRDYPWMVHHGAVDGHNEVIDFERRASFTTLTTALQLYYQTLGVAERDRNTKILHLLSGVL